MKLIHYAVFAALLCVSCTPVRARLKLVEGNVYFSRGLYAEAAGAYIEALKDAKTAPYAAYALGSAYFAMEQDDAALARFGEAEKNATIEKNRELIYRSRYNSGIVRFKNGDFSGAAADFKRAMEADNTRVDAKLNFELSMLSLMQKKEDAQVRTTREGYINEDDRRRKTEILFNYVRQKESDRWKSWDFTGETDVSGEDY
ncbi:MAG: tetratricopeptide repeat protein [Spirochaetaceae bacterium]|nr:tetratricopeptide repeat protein [Spirochaetaceae bacterium]